MMILKHKIAYGLMVIGALNWGLVGLFDFNLVTALFGAWPMIEKLVYILVGVAAVIEIMIHMSYCCYCNMDLQKMGGMQSMMSEKVVSKKKKRK